MISYLFYNAVFLLVVAPESVDLLLVGMTLVVTAVGLRRVLSEFEMNSLDTKPVRNFGNNGPRQYIGSRKQLQHINELDGKTV